MSQEEIQELAQLLINKFIEKKTVDEEYKSMKEILKQYVPVNGIECQNGKVIMVPGDMIFEKNDEKLIFMLSRSTNIPEEIMATYVDEARKASVKYKEDFITVKLKN